MPKGKHCSAQAGSASTTTAPAALSKAPQPSVDRIHELAARILNGDILLPKFQRDFVWDKDQIVDLRDSISLNYPVGNIYCGKAARNYDARIGLATWK